MAVSTEYSCRASKLIFLLHVVPVLRTRRPLSHPYYRAVFSFQSRVVTICTAKWSLYVPPSGHYMYRTVVTICNAQWSLYVPHSGHSMYRTVVTIYTAQWSLYVPHSGHYMYRTVVTICTTSLTFTFPRSAHTLYLCVLCGSQNKQPLFPYTALTDWFYNRDGECLRRGTD